MEITDLIKANSKHLDLELKWFKEVLDTRLKLYFRQEAKVADIFQLSPPRAEALNSNWQLFLEKYHPSLAERLALLLALIPHVEPRMLDVFFIKNAQYDRPFTEFGGANKGAHKGFVPTGETFLFLVAGQRTDLRFSLWQLFQPDHYFARDNILRLERDSQQELPMNGMLSISPEYLAFLTHGQAYKPIFGKDFPAQVIETQLDWKDLVLNGQTRRRIREIQTWIEHGDTLLNEWGMKGRIRPGFRALFYGKPGTGKTMTACLLGKNTGLSVYRVDLSMIVSKYIGETEKNLAKVFDQAESKDWILFFDEADALFGKRSETRSAHDRYANQEVAYLLQRIETFDGIVILASNYRENIDEAFTRRFEAAIHFPLPNADERLQIWKRSISPRAKLGEGVDLEKIAQRFELSGGGIMNALRYVSLEALRDGKPIITMSLLHRGIRRELVKEGKVA